MRRRTGGNYHARVGILTVLTLVVGLVVLLVGAELLVRGASGLARALGLSPLLVGLTVVSFATSAPELAVSLDATLGGRPGLAVGTVVGSNIVNVLLVLGISAVVLPVVVKSQLFRIDIPVMVGLSLLTLLLALDGRLSRLDGLLLFVLLVAYVAVSVVTSRRRDRAAPSHPPSGGAPPTRSRTALDALLVVVGVAMLVAGAGWLVSAATEIGNALGISELVMGLTVVAVGTSLPELATSVVAAVRKQTDMAVGNVVGSNIFNLGAVLGLSAGLSADGIRLEPGAIALDLPIMILVAVALLPVAFTGAVVARWEGLVFIGYYAAYVTYLILASAQHDLLDGFSAVVVGFLLPATALVLLVLGAHEVRRRRARAGAPPGSGGRLPG